MMEQQNEEKLNKKYVNQVRIQDLKMELQYDIKSDFQEQQSDGQKEEGRKTYF